MCVHHMHLNISYDTVRVSNNGSLRGDDSLFRYGLIVLRRGGAPAPPVVTGRGRDFPWGIFNNTERSWFVSLLNQRFEARQTGVLTVLMRSHCAVSVITVPSGRPPIRSVHTIRRYAGRILKC